MEGKKLLVLILGITASIAVLFLIIYGGVTNNPALYTPGIGVITSALGAFVGHYFEGDKRNDVG